MRSEMKNYMQIRERKRAFISLVAVALFFFSTIYVSNTALLPTTSDDSLRNVAVSNDTPEWVDTAYSAQDQQVGNDVYWNQDANSTSDEWEWEHRNWLFGPSPEYYIYHENGSLLTDDSYAEINEDLTFYAVIPKSVFGNKDTDLARLNFNGWYISQNWSEYNANFDFSVDMQFRNFEIDPAVPTSSDTVTVSVDVSGSNIQYVWINYWTENGGSFNEEMSFVSGSTWEYTIPAYPDGEEVFVRFDMQTTEDWWYSSGETSYIVGSGATGDILRWDVWSSEYNASLQDPWGYEPYIDFNYDKSNVTEDSEMYYVAFNVAFNDGAPIGLFELNYNFVDSTGNWYDSWSFGNSYEMQFIAVGIPPDDAWSYSRGGKYTLEKIDLEGDTLYSASRNTDFTMRFNVSGADPEYIQLGFRVPNWLETWVNVTGWHQELVTEQGGWVYDNTLDTYVWNASIEVSYMKEVYGPYQERRSTEIGTHMEETFYHLEWNETHGYHVKEYTWWIEKQFFFVYNHTTESFDTFYGYQYWGYRYPTYQQELQEYNEEIWVYEPIPAEVPIFYELNTSECSAVKTDKWLTVSFVGHFTDKMPKTTEYYSFWFDDVVMGPDNWHYWPDTWGDGALQTYSEYEIARKIAVETPVTIAKILLEDGTSPGGWMMAVEKNENFMVRGRLQGGSDVSTDLDGSRFTLTAWDSYWSEEETRWSRLNYEINVDRNGIPHLKAYNYTQKNNYTYGTYWDWAEVEVEGWHYVYDSATNTWDWEYGNFTEWQWVELEGWHWQWWYYNQKTGEWQTQWIQEKSEFTKVPATFAQVTAYNEWHDGGDFFVSFLVNMSSTVPDTNYWWDFAFMNNTWYEDYSSEWGLHEIESWNREWTYSFLSSGERVYVDMFEHNQLAYYNDTLCLNEGVDFLLGREAPYIELKGEKLPVKVIENYDPWSGQTYDNIFFYDHYDHLTQKDVYRYDLTNGSSVEVQYDNVMHIYNVTLGTGESFLSGQKWSRSYYYNSQYYYYWMDIDGNIYQGTSWDNYADYSPLVSVEIHERITLDSEPWHLEEWFVRYGATNVLWLAEHWRWDSRTGTYFMTDVDGALYELDYNSNDGYYYTTIGGTYQRVSWPQHYFAVDYEGSTAIIFTWDIHRYFYTEIDEVKYEMPYPGANANYHWDMENTESKGGKVPSSKSVWYNGAYRAIYNDTVDPYIYWLDYGGVSYELYESPEIHSMANGTHIWNPDTVGWTIQSGTYDEYFTFTFKEMLNYTVGNSWGDPDYDDVHDEYYVTLTNGTVMIVEDNRQTRVFEYNLDGDIFNSTNEYPRWFDNGNESFNYFVDIDGNWHNLTNWYRPPTENAYLVEVIYNGSFSYFELDGTNYSYTHDSWLLFTWLFTNNDTSDTINSIQDPWGRKKPILQFDYRGTMVNATPSLENIYKLRMRWGHEMVYGLTPIESTLYKNFNDLVIGNPEWGMWGVKKWTTNPDNGALDLDGDLDTTEDQYYVMESYESKDSWTHEWDFMDVSLMWNPNATAWGDEMNVHSWMGVNTFTWTYEWNQTFFWYYADDMTPLTPTEMADIQDIVLNEEEDPRPGYWDIAWMAKNVTWQDLLQEAEENGWDWISDEGQTWTWLSFGIGQNYGTDYWDEVNQQYSYLGVGMHYEFSGLMIWEDFNENGLMDVDLTDPGSGELSHYLIPDNVESVSFVTPGEAYGNYNQSDSIFLNITDEVTWGVTFSNVNGTVFPFTLNGYWGWYDEVASGSDMRTFDERPTKVTINEISFLVHFQGYLNETEGGNNYATIKVDNYIGDWSVHMLGGRANLENRSLALNYFADVTLQGHTFSVKANGTEANAESSVSSSNFNLASAQTNAQFAEMIMGGVAYDWGKNMSSRYDVLSYTTPVGTFRTAFESESGKSASAWSFSSTMFYVTIGFPYWDGYSVYQDPVFVSYTSSQGMQAGPGGLSFGTFSIDPAIPTASDSVTVSVDIYSNDPLNQEDLELLYWVGGDSPTSTEMWNDYNQRWSGSIPPHADGTEVFFQVVVHTEQGDYASAVHSYIVGQGMVTVTTTTGPTGPIGDVPVELLVLIAGGVLVLVIVLVLVVRRRR